MDTVTSKRRSEIMSRIRGKDTLPEMFVRRLVYGMGFRYRLHVKTLPGTPDLVFRRLGKIIEVNGCFWHCHRGCRAGRLPKSRVEYWTPKLDGNRRRDARKQRGWRAAGWDVLVVWECELKNTPKVTGKILRFLTR